MSVLPMLKYRPAATDIEIQFVRGPRDFRCDPEFAVHDNVATSGIRERVFERQDLVIRFSMPAMVVGDDFEDWAAFVRWAAEGGTFQFSPRAAGSAWYNCVLEQADWKPSRVAAKVLAAEFAFRIVPDEHAPADVGVVMKDFYGVAS